MDLGDRFAGSTFYTKFTTVNASGVPTTLGNSPTLEFYVGAGASAFSVGLSLDVDFNSRTGMNMVTVIATSSATAWTSGIDVQVVVATGSVSGVSLKGYKVCEFSLQNRAGLRPTVQGRNLVVNATGGTAIDWANVQNPTTALNLSATNIDVDQVVASVSGAVGSVTGAVGSVTGNVGGNVTGSVGSVVGAVGSVTGNVGGNVVGTVASVVGNVGGNVTGSVGSVVGAVGSVTGAVGSVTGNVGGNVVGSVGSVVGAVGSVTGAVGSVTDVTNIVTGAITVSSGVASADVKKINNVTIIGDGSGTPFNV